MNLKTFNYFLEKPLEQKRGFLPSVEHKFNLNDKLSLLYSFTVNRKNIVEDISFLFEGNVSKNLLAEMSCFIEKSVGQDLDEITLGNGPSSQFLSIPSVFFYQLLKKFKTGRIEDYSFRASKLLCRCFGVSESEVRKLIVADSAQSVVDITNLSLAGAGCSSCTKDIEEFIFKTKDQLALNLAKGEEARFDTKGKYLLIGGLAPAEMILRIDEALNQKSSPWKEAEICDLRGYELCISGVKKEELSPIEEFLFREMNIRFHLFLG